MTNTPTSGGISFLWIKLLKTSVLARSKMALQPPQSCFQPIEIETAVEVQVFHREQREERPGPAPAKDPFFAPFDNTQRSDGVRRRGQSQSPQRQPLRFRSGRELQTSQPRTRDRRNANEDDNQQKAVHAMDQESLHKQSGASVPPIFQHDSMACRTEEAD